MAARTVDPNNVTLQLICPVCKKTLVQPVVETVAVGGAMCADCDSECELDLVIVSES